VIVARTPRSASTLGRLTPPGTSRRRNRRPDDGHHPCPVRGARRAQADRGGVCAGGGGEHGAARGADVCQSRWRPPCSPPPTTCCATRKTVAISGLLTSSLRPRQPRRRSYPPPPPPWLGHPPPRRMTRTQSELLGRMISITDGRVRSSLARWAAASTRPVGAAVRKPRQHRGQVGDAFRFHQRLVTTLCNRWNCVRRFSRSILRRALLQGGVRTTDGRHAAAATRMAAPR